MVAKESKICTLYLISLEEVTNNDLIASAIKEDDSTLWYKRMGHMILHVRRD